MGGMLDQETLLQTTEHAGEPSGVFNARFTHISRSSVKLAGSDGTTLFAQSMNGPGSAAVFEKGKGETFQRLTLGHNTGLPLMAGTASTQSYVARLSGPKSTVFLAGPDELIYAQSKKAVTKENAKKNIMTIANQQTKFLQMRNDGRLIVGENKQGYLYVSGNAHIEGELRTILDGKVVNVNEEMVRVKEENMSMRKLLQEMQQQNAALMARMESLETAMAAR